MKKFTVFLCSFGLILGLASNAGALYYEFWPSSSAGGTASATLDISISGTTLTATLVNTSPTTLDSGSGYNTPGITGFGFDLLNGPTLSGWSLKAYETDLTPLDPPVLIGSPDNDIGYNGIADTTDDEWILNTTIASVTRDYLPTTDGSNIDGALFNPAAFGSAALPGGENDVFFTTAVLTLNFVLGPDDPDPILDPSSLFVRMQRVGENGAGSVKLFVPEPSTMLLLGVGLIALAAVGRKQFFKRP